MSDRKNVSGTVGGSDGAGAASAEREARVARRGADGVDKLPSVDSESDDKNDDVELPHCGSESRAQCQHLLGPCNHRDDAARDRVHFCLQRGQPARRRTI